MLYGLNLLGTLVEGDVELHEMIMSSIPEDELVNGLTMVGLFLLKTLEHKTGIDPTTLLAKAKEAAIAKNNPIL